MGYSGAFPDEFDWKGGDGPWSAAAAWIDLEEQPGPPTPGSDVIIGGSSSVYLDVGAVVDGLYIGNGGGVLGVLATLALSLHNNIR